VIIVEKPSFASVTSCKEVLHDMLKLCGQSFDAQICSCIWMDTLLMSASSECIHVAGIHSSSNILFARIASVAAIKAYFCTRSVTNCGVRM